MYRMVVLLAGLRTFVSGLSPPDPDTGCDVTVLLLEKMLVDLSKRFDDLESQRRLDTMEMSVLRRDIEEIKSENRQLKTDLKRMASSEYDKQHDNAGRNGSSQPSDLGAYIDSLIPTNDEKTDSSPSDTKPVEIGSIHVDDKSRVNQTRIRRDPSSLAPHLTNRVASIGNVAFFSTLNHDLIDVAKEQIIPFENVVTNNGGHYSQHSGVFTCDTEGTYVFSWTIYASYTHWIDTELIKNNHAIAYSSAGDRTFHDASGSIAVVNLSPGDMVWTRVRDRAVGSDIKALVSMFCGFKI
ncbi:caprin-2-like [Pecten maximus]|uniref:caprin-2-like n=1 Tax=Pecten maximus TaxID=6579 RepID=UPI0014588C76|nr:caprin-2-like [Pecten maximus]